MWDKIIRLYLSVCPQPRPGERRIVLVFILFVTSLPNVSLPNVFLFSFMTKYFDLLTSVQQKMTIPESFLDISVEEVHLFNDLHLRKPSVFGPLRSPNNPWRNTALLGLALARSGATCKFKQ